PTRLRPRGWTSFLTNACLQLQFAWRVAPLRVQRTNRFAHSNMAGGGHVPPSGQPQACLIQDHCEHDSARLSSRPARLRPRRRGCGGGVLGPEVAGVFAFLLGPNRRPRSLPEARKIAGDLDWPVRRREQMESERQLAVADRWMSRQAKQLLHPDVQGRSTRRRVVDGVTVARRRLQVRRSLLL